MDKYHPGYFGKVGMRHFHLKKNQTWRPVINLDQIWSLAGEGVREKYKNTEKVPVIDALQNGYGKVLAKGSVSQPVIVRTRYVSRRAEEKIKAAGGVVELIA
ncbi:60S ribosomal protein L28-B [Radiomyces spectabilis]|nr:60S ribosomal protein L28-B [Radiomyces spectabilis]XP_051421983.1 60S ribosomal protein L28-B [Radiomyces spectabilis]KAI8366833.1 60S ribosomal protein L28-B [Radiomyces spectabilis]KAI8374720.1 60S ribosomal protein L28-B [Radiomyces spectabilis]